MNSLRVWRWRVLVATWWSYAGFYFCRKTFGILKGPLKEALQVDDLQLAHVWTAYLVAYMIGQFLAGWLGSRVACRRLLLVGMGVSALANLGFGVSAQHGAYYAFLGLMVLNGFAQATGWPGNIGVLAPWFGRAERGTVIGLWGTCYQFGSVGAKAFAAFMFGWMGLAWSFWGASLVLLAVWGLFYLLQADRPEDVGLPPVLKEEPEAKVRAGIGGWSPAALRSVMVMGAAYFSFKFLRYALDSWSALVLAERFDLSVTSAGYLSTVFDLVGFASVIFAGWATDRFWAGRRAPLAFLLSLGMVAAAGFLFAFGLQHVLLFAAGLALLGFTLFGPDSLLSGVGAIDVGSARGAALAAGIVNGMGSLGPIVQEEAIGYIKVTWGTDAVFLLLVFVAMLGACGTGLLWLWGRSGRSRF